MQIPHFNAQIIPRYEISARIAELHIANWTDDFAEETSIGRIVRFLELLGMAIAQRRRSHIAQPDGALAARIHEQIAFGWMKFGGGDDFGQFLHVGRFDVDDIETLIGNF